MSAKQGPPDDPKSYAFVLRKIAEHDPEIEESVNGYDEAVYSRDVTHHDGKRRRTVFITSPYFRDRLVRMGWEDVTEDWRAGKAAAAPKAGRRVIARVAG